jgi:hypothetical protein
MVLREPLLLREVLAGEMRDDVGTRERYSKTRRR